MQRALTYSFNRMKRVAGNKVYGANRVEGIRIIDFNWFIRTYSLLKLCHTKQGLGL